MTLAPWRSMIVVAFGLALSVLAACGQHPASAAAPAQPRVAALAPALTLMFDDLHAGAMLVARHGWDRTHTDLPVAGDQSGLDYEALVRARPTHVLLQWGERDLPERLLALGREQGWVIKSFPLLTLVDIQSALAWINSQVVEPARAPGDRTNPPDLLGSIDALRSPHAAHAGSVLLVHTGAAPDVLGPGSYHHEILVRIGGVPAITTGKAFMTLDAEDVLRLNPGAIILIQPREPGTPSFTGARDAKALAPRLGRLATLDIDAVRTGRIALIDDPLALSPSTSLVEIARQMRDILDAWGRAAGPPPQRAP